jgi:hypothetical protein
VAFLFKFAYFGARRKRMVVSGGGPFRTPEEAMLSREDVESVLVREPTGKVRESDQKRRETVFEEVLLSFAEESERVA